MIFRKNLKILSEFPEVELYWLLNGKGTFPSTSSPDTQKIIKQDSETTSQNSETSKIEIPNDKSIERIVIFYKDGTFKNFEHL